MIGEEGWKSVDAARRHIKTADILVPGRQETLSIVATLATAFVTDKPNIMDIGCGNGDLTAKILELCPKASVCMIDYSEVLLLKAEERFGKNNRIRIINHDLNNGVPEELRSFKFDAVVSSHALHHVKPAKKTELFKQIRQVLGEDGLFINGDRFICESPVINGWEFDNWVSWMTGRINELGRERTFDEVKKTQIEMDEKLGDKPGTLGDTRRDLEQACFKYTDCVWKSYNMAVIVASSR